MEKALPREVSGSGLNAAHEIFLVQVMLQPGQGRDKLFVALVPQCPLFGDDTFI